MNVMTLNHYEKFDFLEINENITHTLQPPKTKDNVPT